MPHLRVRGSGGRAVPGRTLERGKGRNQVAASIKEQNCDRQINKIYRDKMVAYLSSFYGTAGITPARSSSYQRPLGLGPPSLNTRVISEERVALIQIEEPPPDLPSSPAAPEPSRPAQPHPSATTQSARTSQGLSHSRRTAAP